MQEDYALNLDIKYVKNANEAHDDLMQQHADIVFMSYDDTLSMAVQDNYHDIAAFMPIHGGILDLCGNLDLYAGKNRVGIDTNTGYARALRLYMRNRYPNYQDYQQISWLMAGATNVRYEKLMDSQIDATLLNPPFSYQDGIHCIGALSGNAVIPYYQGVVANLNKSWLDKPSHQHALCEFIKIYQQVLAVMRNMPEETISKLAKFYELPNTVVSAIYDRLWEDDGLNTTIDFNEQALKQTEQIFYQDTKLEVPQSRYWVLSNPATEKLRFSVCKNHQKAK